MKFTCLKADLTLLPSYPHLTVNFLTCTADSMSKRPGWDRLVTALYSFWHVLITHPHMGGSRGNPCPFPLPGEHLKGLSHKIGINCCHLSNNESSVMTTRHYVLFNNGLPMVFLWKTKFEIQNIEIKPYFQYFKWKTSIHIGNIICTDDKLMYTADFVRKIFG